MDDETDIEDTEADQIVEDLTDLGVAEADAEIYASYAIGGEDIVIEDEDDDEMPEAIYED